MSQSALRNVLRWAVKLSVYNYTYYHIKGVENIWADLLSRRSTVPTTVRRLFRISELCSTYHDDFEWPTPAVVAAVRKGNSSSQTNDLIRMDSLWN